MNAEFNSIHWLDF